MALTSSPAAQRMGYTAVGIGVLARRRQFSLLTLARSVSTAAEETKNPNRIFRSTHRFARRMHSVLFVGAYTAIGAMGAQPGGELSQSKEPLAFVLRELGYGWNRRFGGGAAILALPSVVLMMMFGQTRILFTMSRDGLLPPVLSEVHSRYKTPHVVTIITGVAVALFAAMFPVDMLADISNSGTLFAFFVVGLGVMVLRKTEPNRARPFRVRFLWVWVLWQWQVAPCCS